MADDPTIALLTALPEEFAACCSVFEATESDPRPGDPLRYASTEVVAVNGGHHRLIIALMVEMGNNYAAAVATHLLRSYPRVLRVIMVGIAAGVPEPNDASKHVRLGDIVVSSELGVVQYDKGRSVNGPSRIGILQINQTLAFSLLRSGLRANV